MIKEAFIAMSHAVIIKNAVKKYGDFTAVNGISLEIKKGDEVISQEVDHVVTYRGHAPVVLRNTSGSVVAPESLPEESTVNPSESSVAPEGAGDGFTPPAGTGTNPSGGSVSGGGPGGGSNSAGNTGNSVGEAPGSVTTQPSPATEAATQPTTAAIQPAPGPAEQSSEQGNIPPMIAPMPGN